MVTVSSAHAGKPPKLRKKGTKTTKSHRFESFSQRVVKLKIDPIHRVQRNSFGDEEDTETSSHFRTSLEHWVELNLSENFAEFSRRVNYLCESLPQILYHEDRIMALLEEYIGKKDELSMEPLLSLMAQFARDLGARFEKNFASAVTLVSSVAATHQNIEVIEWSFTCLAWIFKFLSRLLVPDLRQLLGIMAPYLGKERQKHFVTRFAAESMSFLVRKAALVYYKNKAPLTKAATFLLEDLANCGDARQIGTYKNGLMSMFTDAMKGVNRGVHSNGPDVLRCLMEIVSTQDGTQRALSQQVVGGIVINMIHSTSADTFSPLLDVVCEHIKAAEGDQSPSATGVGIHLIFLALATRKGSRLSNWEQVHQTLLVLLRRASTASDLPPEYVHELLATVVLAVQTSPMDELLSFMRPLMEVVSHENLVEYFLPFCSLFSESGSERFQSVVLPYFQKFINTLWEKNELSLCLVLPKLEQVNCITPQLHRPGYITCPSPWKESIIKRYSTANPTAHDVALLYSYTTLPRAISLHATPSALPQIAQCLHDQVKSSMQSKTGPRTEIDSFLRGQGFLAYVDLATQLDSLDPLLWNSIVSQGPECSNIPVFLEATLAYITSCKELPEFSEESFDAFATALLNNLSGPSQELRLLSLKLLQSALGRLKCDDNGCISTAIDIEESDLTLQTQRSLGMHVRQLALNYKNISSKKWLDRLVPNFCFGLLSKRLASIWQDSCDAIQVICETRVGETIVSELAIRWLEQLPAPESEDIANETPAQNQRIYSEFECFNVCNIEKSTSKAFQDAANAGALILDGFKSTHNPCESTPMTARSQALKVLSAVPAVAEKRVRQLVPHFLSWSANDDASSGAVELTSEPSTTLTDDRKRSSWSMRDRKAMLALFGQFNNPKSFYKSAEVHASLVNLLCNGDSEVQKSSLKVLFTWKHPFLQPYETNLLNIVDEARFRDELSVFVHVGQDNSIIEQEHRSDLFPVLLRLLYGKIVSRGGARSGQQEGRRKVILRTISQLSEIDFGSFVDITFGTLRDVRLIENGHENSQCLSQELMGLRRQFGLLRMIETMFETLKTKMLPFAERSLNAVLYCLVRACRHIRDTADMGDQTSSNSDNHGALIRNIRQIGVQCLDLIFSVSPDTDWNPYMPLIFSEVINPRLDSFAIETAQGVSALLRLFHTWASSPKSALYIISQNDSVIPRVVDILDVGSARDEVKIFVMDEILKTLISLADGKGVSENNVQATSLVRSKVLAPHVEYVLVRLEALLRVQSGRILTMSAIDTLSKLAPLVESSQETTKLISTTTFLLQQPPDRVPPKAKSGLLRVMQHFLPLYDPTGNAELNEQIFDVLSSLFDYFKDNPNRNTLSNVFYAFAQHETDLEDTAKLCADLNALSEKKLDEVDFDRRLAAFATINEQKYQLFTPRQWRPLLFNFVYHVKNEEELAIRTSSSFGLKRFIEVSGPKVDDGDAEFLSLLTKVVLPSLRSGVKQRAETVRAEFVSTMGHLIRLNSNLPAVSDMCGLLAGGDEEASFFNNILHIQQHRRLRALRRLATEGRSGKILPFNISSFFLPLIEHFVFDQGEDENAHNLTAETVTTIGVLSEGLEWSQFRAIFRRYKGYMRSKPGLEKNVIRLLGQFTDGLGRALGIDESAQTTEGGQMEGVEMDPSNKTTLSKSLPSKTQVISELRTHFIPYLSGFAHHKEESEVNLRLPVAVTTIKLLKLLPLEDMALLLPPVLMDVSNVLKSRSQDSRDVARKTLADIALLLGPSYFSYILKELRGALTKGYQLHVLSFTVHSILVITSEHFKQGDLDDNLGELTTIVMDDIFGTVGQEKDAEGYVSKMKEVKSSKSYDSMELLAVNSSVRHLSALLRPIQTLLKEKLTSSLVKKIDELLRRIGVGLLRNPGAESRDLLVFCYEVIKESYKTEVAPKPEEGRLAQSRARFMVRLFHPKNTANRGSTSSYLYKLSRFGLDVLRSVLNKFNSLNNPGNVAGFLPIIGDALLQAYEEVKLSAIRLLSTIIKLPLPELDKNANVYLIEAIKLIKEAPSTNSEAAQAAIKLIASTLRERRNTTIKDSHLGYLLKRVSTDIDEPDRQGVTFNFIRAVMARKFVVPEMYELADSIAAMMVTNHTRSARDLARGVYVHFLIEYPQAKNRWTKQLAFLAKNLEYPHKEGRQSVMEAIHMLLSKTNGEPAQDIVGTFFIPVVMVMANDESSECREMAGVLLSDTFIRAEKEQLKSMLTPLRTWVEQTENSLLTSTGLQAMRIFFAADVSGNKENEVRFITDLLPDIITAALGNQDEGEWEILYYSLQLFIKLCQRFPSLVLTEDCTGIWTNIRQSLRYPHAWIRSTAANLVGIWLADEAKANAEVGYGSLPLVGASGLKLNDTAMLDITRASMSCLCARTVPEDLATQTIRNLIFLGRCFAQNNLELPSKKVDEVAEESSEESDEEDAPEDVPTDNNTDSRKKTALQFIFQRSASVLRREPINTRAEALVAKTASMKLIAALCTHLEPAQITPSLQTLLLPLLHLTDPSIPAPHSLDEFFEVAYKSLVSSSQEIFDLLQKKLGTTEFVTQINDARAKVMARRDERRVKRKIGAVADPERFGREKRRRNDHKRERRKEKNLGFGGRRRGW
ncbi:hypothetical protein AJ80_04089 [Polytolypa hystricis UAMH7299]|uniref:Uncharacterized protein n=1 Tax=Polytolypa hystricis (strain UAMH7299) TaxID=1447883 RepID=A0A2B7Y505_POLH7|nr:hypothetical protein AJ80_04089 [Polytolypa hystricis UAMH7299]